MNWSIKFCFIWFLRNQKLESDLAHAVTQWRDLEETLISKEAVYSNQLAKTKRLTSEVADLQAQQKRVWTRHTFANILLHFKRLIYWINVTFCSLNYCASQLKGLHNDSLYSDDAFAL